MRRGGELISGARPLHHELFTSSDAVDDGLGQSVEVSLHSLLDVRRRRWHTTERLNGLFETLDTSPDCWERKASFNLGCDLLQGRG